MFIVDFMIAVVLTETITEVLVKSELFKPVRKYLFKKGNKVSDFLHDVLDCGYCTSVWVGCFASLLLLNELKVVHWSIDWFILGLIVHRLSNILHFAIDKLGYLKE